MGRAVRSARNPSPPAKNEKARYESHGPSRFRSPLFDSVTEHRFFSALTLALALIAIIGFARTYVLRPVLPVPSPAPAALTQLIHVHAALFIGWLAVLCAQVRLVARRNLSAHRMLGAAAWVDVAHWLVRLLG